MAPAVLNLLIQTLNNGLLPIPVRVGAAKGLAHANSVAAVKALMAVVENGLLPPDVRAAAAEALGQAGGQV